MGQQAIRSAPGGPTESRRFVGDDGSGCVRVEIDLDVVRPRISLGRGWRSAVGPDGLDSAVLHAFGAATLARLTALATGTDPRAIASGSTSPRPDRDPAPPIPTGAAGVDVVRRAQADLAEFRARLAELNAATRVASSPDRRVNVTVRGGNIVDIDLHRAWRDEAQDEELHRHLEDGLAAALALITTTPQQALDGCPYLIAMLATTLAALPFRLPAGPDPGSQPSTDVDW